MRSSQPLPPPARQFLERKARITQQLAVPESEYTDASPKGSVDAGVRDLIRELNEVDGFVTTSSCAGRVSVFLEGSRDGGGEEETTAGVGGKGGGGNWLYISHDAVPEDQLEAVVASLGLQTGGEEETEFEGRRLIHFKFEPMILHILTASPAHANLLLRCALQAGFRESGALNLTATSQSLPITPMVAVRCMGLTVESIVGCCHGEAGERRMVVSPSYVRALFRLGNQRFEENTKRIQRFRGAVMDATTQTLDEPAWEPAEVRKERKRAEGLRRKAEAQAEKEQRVHEARNDEAPIPLP